MAKMKLSASTFTLIPEGTTTFKIMDVDDSKYEDFGKLEVKMQTSKGETHNERFSLIGNDGELNEKALNAWSFFARTCLNNNRVEEIDTQDLIGCYITADVEHYKYTAKSGEHAGEERTAVRLKKYTPSSGFGESGSKPTTDDLFDLDDLPF